jgi:hypothetical protein
MPLISGGMYLRVCLDDCLPPRCVWLLGIGPEEIILVGGSGLLLCLGSCLGASGSALWLCDRRGRCGGRHGVQCRWMCGMEAIEVEQQLQAVVWCSGRRDDGKAQKHMERFGLDRHTWPNHNPVAAVWTLLSRRLHNRLLRSGTPGPTGETFRPSYHVSAEKEVNGYCGEHKTWKMQLFVDWRYSHRLDIAAWKAHGLQLTGK